MLTKSNSTIYSTFKKGKQDSFADILKSTKSIIRNSSSFNKYINHYTSSIQISAFKSPDRSVYPILKNNNIIPLQKTTYGVNDDTAHSKSRSLNHHPIQNNNDNKQLVKGTFPLFKLKFPEISKVFEDNNNNNNNEHKRYFNHNTKTTRRYKRNHNQLNKSSSALNLLMKGIKCNISYFIRSNQNMLHIQNSTLQAFQINKRDILIQDFMFKWKHYKDLKCYDENEIFHTNTTHYDELIARKMRSLTQEEVSSTKVENPTTVLESTFEDANMSQIYLKLTSMQISFIPIIQRKRSERRKKIVMKFPFAYLFLFYYDDIEFFKYILMTVISFKNNYTEVEFDENKMYEFIKRNFSSMSTQHDINNDDMSLSSHCYYHHQQASSSSSPRKSMSSLLPLRKNLFNKGKRGSTSYINYNNVLNLSSQVEPKTKPNTKRTLVHNSERTYKKFFYNKYTFTWLTPEVNYNVVITTPHVYFEYENCKNPILRYIEKELMMYLYERNFMNWDYYIMCYLFSIKRFRVFIENINSKCGTSDTTLDNNNVFSNHHTFLEKNEYDDSVIHLSPTKKFQFNLKHTRCFFFSTNDLHSTCIVNVSAYTLFIDNDKLNPYSNWKFNLNFGETNFLNNVSLYETLELFLMKIIKTDSSCGKLTLDFTVFTDFDASVLNYKRYYYTKKVLKKEGQNDIKQTTTFAALVDVDDSNKNDVHLEIVCPGVEVECVGFTGIKSIQRFKLDMEMMREMVKMNFKEWPMYIWTHKEKWVDVEVEESGDKTNKAVSWRNRQVKGVKDGIVSPKNHRGSNFKSFEHAKLAFIAENGK